MSIITLHSTNGNTKLCFSLMIKLLKMESNPDLFFIKNNHVQCDQSSINVIVKIWSFYSHKVFEWTKAKGDIALLLWTRLGNKLQV
jgi:hypothetical protein